MKGKATFQLIPGFIVFNNENYPHLNALFNTINAPIKKTSMSFAAHIVHENIEYCGSSLDGLFAQRKNIFSPRYVRFLMQLNAFNKVCLEVLEKPELQSLSIAEYVNNKGWGKIIKLVYFANEFCIMEHTSRHKCEISGINFSSFF
jgi:predicted NAD/FAD-binding protein